MTATSLSSEIVNTIADDLSNPRCRFCNSSSMRSFADLGTAPFCQNLVKQHQLTEPEAFYPLHARICEECLLVQLEQFVSPDEIFNEDYAYFSSYSDSWLQHCRNFADEACARFGLNEESQVLEIASNDGYLLQFFAEHHVPVLGIEPSSKCAQAAIDKGIATEVVFFGRATSQRLANRNLKADLLIGNNVLAHVPALNDFVSGLPLLLKPEGVVSMEFPHLMQLIRHNQFDTIYHEHFSYFALFVVQAIFRYHGLRIFDVDQLQTHGGSLRIYACHENCSEHETTSRVDELVQEERDFGLHDLDTYQSFTQRIVETRWELLSLLIRLKKEGNSIAGYGAAGKGNTLLNYCGIREDLIDFVVDRNPAKQGTYLPGSRIPVLPPEEIERRRPRFILILPWNLKDEIVDQLAFVSQWDARFVIPIPSPQIIGEGSSVDDSVRR